MPDDPKHIHYSDDDLVNPETHHEHSDVNIRALAWFAIIFVILAVVTHFAIHGFYKGLTGVEDRRPVLPLTQLPRGEDASVPRGQPLLQPFPRRAAEGEEVIHPYRNTPVTDLHEMRRAERQALESYGWVDREKGIVRIPIEEAKRRVVERGLPVQTSTGGEP
ncbi:MAG TPA: hypothetical protein VNA04_17215 [Thermoanaerobaculia bacterium]|nr:hypothetical protein [Thermoanaerobaculia bacterium]